MGVIQELGFEFQQRLVLRFEKFVVNGVRSKASGVAISQVLDDPLGEVGNIRTLQPPQPMAKPMFIVTGGVQLPDTVVFNPGYGIVVQSSTQEGLVGNVIRIHPARMRWLPPFHPLGMVEIQIQLILDVGQRLARIFLIIQQGLPVQHFPYSPRYLVPGNPCLHDLVKLSFVSSVLSIQGMIIVVIPRPRNQLLQSLFSIFSYTEFFNILDVPGRENGRKDHGR